VEIVVLKRDACRCRIDGEIVMVMVMLQLLRSLEGESLNRASVRANAGLRPSED
jgi:hypothetical protein